jgi:hypothetical protein
MIADMVESYMLFPVEVRVEDVGSAAPGDGRSGTGTGTGNGRELGLL